MRSSYAVLAVAFVSSRRKASDRFDRLRAPARKAFRHYENRTEFTPRCASLASASYYPEELQGRVSKSPQERHRPTEASADALEARGELGASADVSFAGFLLRVHCICCLSEFREERFVN